MKKLNFLVLLMGVIALATTSCKKDNGDDNNGGGGGDNPPAEKTCYMNKFSTDDGDYTTITYNADKHVKEAVDYDSTGTIAGYTEFTYNSDKKLSKMEGQDENHQPKMKMEFMYSGGKMDSVIIFDYNNGSFERSVAFAVSYNGEKISKVETVMSMNGATIVVAKDEFTYTGDNMTHKASYQFDMTAMSLKLTGTTDYEYDSKKSPYHGIGLDNMFLFDDAFMSVNNITKTTVKDKDGVVKQDQSYNNTIEYTENNYPSKFTEVTFDNSRTGITVFTYDCN